MRFLAPTLLLGLFSTLSWAQDPIPGYRLFSNVDYWTTDVPAGTASFQALLVGKVTSPADQDVIALRGGELHLCIALASRDKEVRLATGVPPVTVTGALVLPGQGIGGDGPDAVLSTSFGDSVHPCGLTKWTWTGGLTGQPVCSYIDGVSEWQGATRLRKGSGNFLYAINSAGTAVLRASVANGTFTPKGSFTLTAGPRDIQPIDWNWDGVEDIAVLYDGLLEVRSTGSWGSPLVTYLAGSTDLICTSRGHGTERDVLAQTYEISGGGYLRATNSAPTDVIIALGPPCWGLASCDWDFDPDYTGTVRDDLLLSSSISRDVYVFQRQAPGSTHYPFWLPSTVANPNTIAPCFFENDPQGSGSPALATLAAGGDMDGDGDIDVLLGLPDRNSIQAALNGRIERADLGPIITPDQPVPVTWPSGVLNFTYAQRNAGATKLQLEIRYKQPLLQGGIYSYDPSAPSVLVLPPPQDLPFPAANPAHVSISNSNVTINSVLELTFREANGTGPVGPSITYFYSGNQNVWYGLVNTEPGIKQYHPYIYFTTGGGPTVGGQGLPPQHP